MGLVDVQEALTKAWPWTSAFSRQLLQVRPKPFQGSHLSSSARTTAVTTRRAGSECTVSSSPTPMPRRSGPQVAAMFV